MTGYKIKRPFYCFLILVSLFSTFASAQTFTAVPADVPDQSQLAAGLKTFKVYNLSIADVSDYVHSHSSGAPCKFVMGDQVFEWTLIENQMLRPEAKGTTMRDGVYHDLDLDRSCRTYIGYRPGSREEARFTVTKNNFTAMIPEGGTIVYIQPLFHYIKNADRNLVVLFRESDVIKENLGYCDVSSILPVEKDPGLHEKDIKSPPPPGGRTVDCLELEVAFATDHRMFMELDSADAILDFNLTVLNQMEPFYDDFDLDFWVEDFFIVTSTSPYDTPWGLELDAGILIDDFGNWADDYFGQQDIGHLWTSGNLYNDEGSGVIGRAAIGGACGDIGITPWCILERFTTDDFYSLALLQAHEYGHLLDADHEPNTGTIMEPSLGLVESATWAQANIDEMNSFIEDESCIQSCIQCPLSYNIIDYIGWGVWHYSASINITSNAVIDGSADVLFNAAQFITLTPGFTASGHHPSSSNVKFEAKIVTCN